MTNNDRRTQHPIATTASLPGQPLVVTAGHRRNNSTFRVKPYQTSPKKSTFAHSPMVMAMITNNRLSNCQDIGKMVQECRRAGSDDQVCQTATNYMQSCVLSAE